MNCLKPELSEAEYRSHPAIGSSQVKALREVPVFLHHEDNPLTVKPDMHRGTLSHAATLERLTKSQLAERFPIERRAGWKEEDQENSLFLAQKVHSHPLISRILKVGKPEVSVFGELCGVECKGRIDWYQDLDDDAKVMVKRKGVPFAVDSSAINLYDLKTLSKGMAEQEAFMKYVGNNDLHVQAAFYHDLVQKVLGSAPARFSWIAVEREPPYMMAVYNAADWLPLGRFEDERNLQHYRDYLQLNPEKRESLKFAGYHEDERILPVPAWKMKGIYE